MDPINLETGASSPTGNSPAHRYTWTNNRHELHTCIQSSPAVEQCKDIHVRRGDSFTAPAVKWGYVSRPVSVQMIYAAVLEQLSLLPWEQTVHLQPTFFTSCTRVPAGRLLTDQQLQMGFKLDFTFNTPATALRAQSSVCAGSAIIF